MTTDQLTDQITKDESTSESEFSRACRERERYLDFYRINGRLPDSSAEVLNWAKTYYKYGT